MLSFFQRFSRQNNEKLLSDQTWAHAGQAASEKLYVLLFFALVITVTYLAYFSLKEMLSVGFLTVLFGSLLWPAYQKINRILPGPPLLASIVTIVLAIAVGLVPLILVGQMLLDQFINLASLFDVVAVQQSIKSLIDQFNELVSPIPVIGPYLVVDYTVVLNSVWEAFAAIVSSLVNLAYIGGQGAMKLFINFFLIAALLFYALPDMGKFKDWLIQNSPFSQQTTKLYLRRSHSMMVDVIRGSVVVAFVQALLTAAFLIILQVPTAGVIAILVFFFALLPIFGSGIVLVPVSLYYLLTGNYVIGIAIFLYQILIVASVDNVLRPVLVSEESHIHPALMLLAVVGGVATMGVMGLLYGPLIMILFLTTVEVYNKEFKHQRNNR